ncbi:uncharacterized protein LOC111881602 [Lactuca sativa]|uniref:uncharacterized protein LOC111881602 n=1 Tax=Lactuca sativa TaxID=4236 RepID=UPI000CD851F5|nr:uncharacterized protein LOC111881602 [Lactuca sativa]
MIESRASNKVEVGEKRKFEGSPRSNEKRKFSKSGSMKFEGGGRGEARWCNKCNKKNFGRCHGEVNCHKCGRTGHYSRDCQFDKKKCYKCGDGGHILKNCPKKNEVAMQNPSLKPKAKAFQMILDEVGDNARDQE